MSSTKAIILGCGFWIIIFSFNFWKLLLICAIVLHLNGENFSMVHDESLVWSFRVFWRSFRWLRKESNRLRNLIIFSAFHMEFFKLHYATNWRLSDNSDKWIDPKGSIVKIKFIAVIKYYILQAINDIKPLM